MKTLDPDGKAEIVVNLQGDFPTITPDNIRSVLPPLADPAVDISTLASEIHTEEEDTSPERGEGGRLADRPAAAARAVFHPRHRALRRRAALPSYRPLCLSPRGAGAFRPAAALAAGAQEKLEQLRALEAGMRIDITIVDTVPRGVDTPADLETARRILAKA